MTDEDDISGSDLEDIGGSDDSDACHERYENCYSDDEKNKSMLRANPRC